MDPLLSYDADARALVLSFPYDPHLVERVKEVYGARYRKKTKTWELPATPEVAKQVVDMFNPDAGPGFADWYHGAVKQRKAAEMARKTLDGTAEVTGDLNFNFHIESYAHQRQYCEWAALRSLSGLTYRAQFSEQGTGKTKAEIDMTVWEVDRGLMTGMLLIFCPNSVKSTWCEEINQFAPPGLFLPLPISGTCEEKIHALDQLRVQMSSSGMLPAAIINYDIMAQPTQEQVFDKLRALAMQGVFGKVIFDESTKIKNAKSKRGKAAFLLAKEIPIRVIMDGTPFTKDMLDIFNPMRCLSPEVLGSNWPAFRKHHVKLGGYQGKEVVGFLHEQELEDKVARHSFRKLLDECTDMPEEIDMTRICEYSAAQIKATKELREELLTLLQDEEQIIALGAGNALARLVRFNQIASGFIEKDDKLHYFNPNPKLQLLLGILEDEVPAHEKVVVWCAYKADIRAISKELDKLKISHARYYGDLNAEERAVEEKRFRDLPGCRFMLATPDTGGLGLNWQCACWCIFYSYGFNMGLIEQARTRIRRINQDKRMTFLWLRAENPVTRRASHGVSSGINSWILKNLYEKKDMAKFFTGDFRKVAEDGRDSPPDPLALLRQALEIV